MNRSRLDLVTQALPLGAGIPRSPSHDSFATDLSLMSLSSLGSEVAARGRARAPDGASSSHLQVPSERFGEGRLSDEVLYEEGNEVIRSCGALSSMLGLMRSFSTGDLDQSLLAPRAEDGPRASVSAMVLNSWHAYDLPYGRLEYTSRSCSTWVAVGDVSVTSQLPSPQVLPGEGEALTAVDFVKAINKKVRQMYIRRRLESTYRALERLTRSELDLDMPRPVLPGAPGAPGPLPQFSVSTELERSLRQELQISSVGFNGANKTLSLTVKDIEREKGKPLSKYERNMMIFNWLQSLDETAFEQLK